MNDDLIKNLITGADRDPFTRVESLREVGLDYMSYVTPDFDVRINGEFTTLKGKAQETGETFVFTLGLNNLHPPASVYLESQYTSGGTAIYTSNDDITASKFTPAASPFNALSAAPRVRTVVEPHNNSINSGTTYPMEVGMRRMFHTGGSGLMFVSEGSAPEQNTPPTNSTAYPYTERYDWFCFDLLNMLNISPFYRYTTPVVSIGRLDERSPVGCAVVVGGQLRGFPMTYDITDYLTTLPAGATGYQAKNPNNLNIRRSHGHIASNGPSPFGPYWSQYSIAAPAKVKGHLCYGIAAISAPSEGEFLTSGETNPFFLRPFQFADREGPKQRIVYNGEDAAGRFTAEITPTYEYSGNLGECLVAHLMGPQVFRVGPSTLCMAVYSTPLSREYTGVDADAAYEAFLQGEATQFEAFYEYTGMVGDIAQYEPKDEADTPENFAFMFWSTDNGRSWAQLPDNLWFSGITGTPATWHSVAMNSMAAHMHRHTAFLQDTADSCLMVVAVPHCADHGFDFSTTSFKVADDKGGYANIPTFAHRRPKSELLSRINPDGMAGPWFPHDKFGICDIYDLTPKIKNNLATLVPIALDNAMFNTRLWRWNVFRVSAAGVQHLSTLPDIYPPCDFAVSRSSGATRDLHYIQLKPTYYSEQPSVLFVSEDRGVSWVERTLPQTKLGGNGSGVGLVYALPKNRLVVSTMEWRDADNDMRIMPISLRVSEDAGKTWKLYSRCLTVRLHKGYFRDYPGGYPITLPDSTLEYAVAGPGWGVTMNDGFWVWDFILTADEDGNPVPINPCRPWLNDDSKEPPQ